MSESSVSLATGATKRLDAKTQPDTVVQPSDVADATTLARILTRMLSTVAELGRAFRPNAVTFRDIAVGGTATVPVSFTLAHKLGGRVEWWATRVTAQPGGSVIAGSANPLLVEMANDGNTLTLRASFTASIDVRVQAVP